jgi:hypothetical protein
MTSSSDKKVDKKVELKADDVVWREVGDELIVLELATSTYLTLNGTAKHLWLTLADGATFDELVDSLAGRYRISDEQARTDATSFLEALTARDLIVPDP